MTRKLTISGILVMVGFAATWWNVSLIGAAPAEITIPQSLKPIVL